MATTSFLLDPYGIYRFGPLAFSHLDGTRDAVKNATDFSKSLLHPGVMATASGTILYEPPEGILVRLESSGKIAHSLKMRHALLFSQASNKRDTSKRHSRQYNSEFSHIAQNTYISDWSRRCFCLSGCNAILKPRYCDCDITPSERRLLYRTKWKAANGVASAASLQFTNDNFTLDKLCWVQEDRTFAVRHNDRQRSRTQRRPQRWKPGKCIVWLERQDHAI